MNGFTLEETRRSLGDFEVGERASVCARARLCVCARVSVYARASLCMCAHTCTYLWGQMWIGGSKGSPGTAVLTV